MQKSTPIVQIIGGGLAGAEATWQLVSRGIPVTLHEMRPIRMTKAHRSGRLAELVCSNSFRGADLANAVGLLKEELKLLKSLVMESALISQVPAGGALAVDRTVFSEYIDNKLRTHPLVEIISEEIKEVPSASPTKPVIVATGPLTSESLAHSIESLTGQGRLSFFDAISPIILGESLNLEKLFRQSRYDKGDGADYLNIPLDQDLYYRFIHEVSRAEKFGGHEEVEADCIENLRPFEGCMPIEEMISRGPDTLLFGPLKPVGLIDPRSGQRPYAVMQLRQDDLAGHLWSMVGMQTRLKHPEQLRIFRMLPGLENADFVRLGSVHRNSFINSPLCLNSTLEFRSIPGLFFAGQITGVEGYVESTAAGLVAGVNVARMLGNRPLVSFPAVTAIGSLMNYISDENRKHFQPMNISFGLMPSYLDSESDGRKRRKISKRDRRLAASESSLKELEEFAAQEL